MAQLTQTVGTPAKVTNELDVNGEKADEIMQAQNPEDAGEGGVSYKPKTDMILDDMGESAVNGA